MAAIPQMMQKWFDLVQLSTSLVQKQIIQHAISEGAVYLGQVQSMTTAQDMLQKVDRCCEVLMAALSKGLFVNSYRVVFDILTVVIYLVVFVYVEDKTKCSAPGTDDLLPLFVHTLHCARLKSPQCLTSFMEMHASDEMSGRHGYVLAVWCAAISKICTATQNL